MNTAQKAAGMVAQAEGGRIARYNQLLDSLNNLRTVTDRVNDLALSLGVPRAEPIAAPAMKEPATKNPAPAQVDNLVSVLNMLPQAIDCEVERIHATLSDIQNSLV